MSVYRFKDRLEYTEGKKKKKKKKKRAASFHELEPTCLALTNKPLQVCRKRRVEPDLPRERVRGIKRYYPAVQILHGWSKGILLQQTKSANFPTFQLKPMSPLQ